MTYDKSLSQLDPKIILNFLTEAKVEEMHSWRAGVEVWPAQQES